MKGISAKSDLTDAVLKRIGDIAGDNGDGGGAGACDCRKEHIRFLRVSCSVEQSLNRQGGTGTYTKDERRTEPENRQGGAGMADLERERDGGQLRPEKQSTERHARTNTVVKGILDGVMDDLDRRERSL